MFKIYPWRYVFQCSIAAVAIGIILSFLDIFSHTAIIATLGATCFVLFILPHSYFARSRPLFGGYVVGIMTGCLFSFINQLIFKFGWILSHQLSVVVCGALAVGIAIFVMAVFNFEHPPAAGISLSLVLNVWKIDTLIFILCAVFIVYAIKRFLGERIIDLL